MKKLLLATVALVALSLPAQAAVISNLGVNPNSATGRFANAVFGAAFTDQYSFQLVGADQFLTFASATNDYAQPTDFITNFTGQLFSQIGAIGGGDDIPVSAPVAAVDCQQNPDGCQLLAGSALLAAGNYYLQISGIGGGTSGYGGNLTTFAVSEVPIPAVGAGVPGLIAGFGAFLAWRKRQKKQAAQMQALSA